MLSKRYESTEVDCSTTCNVVQVYRLLTMVRSVIVTSESPILLFFTIVKNKSKVLHATLLIGSTFDIVKNVYIICPYY